MAAKSFCRGPCTSYNKSLQPSFLSLKPHARTCKSSTVGAFRGEGPSATGSQQSNRSGLEAFYYGRAVAQLVSERIGAALEDLASELGKADAERRQALREFQEEVEARARADMLREGASSQTSTSAPTPTYGQNSVNGYSNRPEIVKIPPQDLEETVDELRAEIASTRSALQLLKSRSVGRL